MAPGMHTMWRATQHNPTPPHVTVHLHSTHLQHLRQLLARRRVCDSHILPAVGMHPLVVDEHAELAVMGVQPRVGVVCGLGCDAVVHGVEQRRQVRRRVHGLCRGVPSCTRSSLARCRRARGGLGRSLGAGAAVRGSAEGASPGEPIGGPGKACQRCWANCLAEQAACGKHSGRERGEGGWGCDSTREWGPHNNKRVPGGGQKRAMRGEFRQAPGCGVRIQGINHSSPMESVFWMIR